MREGGNNKGAQGTPSRITYVCKNKGWVGKSVTGGLHWAQ